MTDRVPLQAPLGAANPDSVAIQCIDVRYRAAFDELLREVLGHDPYRVELPGGPWWLAQVANARGGRVRRFVVGRLPVRDFLDSFLAGRHVNRVVLMGHGDCVWYRENEPGLSAGGLIRLQGEHMLRARDEIKRWLPRLDISGYLVQAEEEGMVGRRIF